MRDRRPFRSTVPLLKGNPMRFKFVLIGGGSLRWTPPLATDLFLTESLDGSELVLVDIDAEAAELMQRYCRMIGEQIGCDWRVSVQNLESALDGADGVCVSISTGGFDAMHLDYTVPERFGIYHTVGDTVGPGGISRTLRNVPVFVDIARKMEKYCPDTWMLHVTNPLSQLTRSVWKTSSIRCVGLCHNFSDTIIQLADFLGCDRSDLFAVSVGVNHYTWLKDLTCRGKEIGERLTLKNYIEYEARKGGKPVRTGSIDDRIEEDTAVAGSLSYRLNFELYEIFGVFPVGAAPHVVENLPWYANDPKTLQRHQIRRKGVLPARRDGAKRLRRETIDIVEGRQPLPEPRKSVELVAPVTESLCTGKPFQAVVSLPNEGQITDLPRDAVVETWAMVRRNRILPVHSGAMPAPVLGLMQLIVDEQELAVEAALTGDRDKVVQAMYVSPMLHDKDRAPELADALLDATRQWLPQFRKKAEA